MECPRCGESMTHYQLGDSETWSCEGCQYSGVPVEHRSNKSTPESWDECLQRFYSEQDDGAGADAAASEATTGSAASEATTESATSAAGSTDDADRTPAQCAAATNAGSRCSRNALDEERYCSQHLGMVERDGPGAVADYDE